MTMKARELYKMLRGDGTLPRSRAELRNTTAFRHISEACGLDTEGHEVRGASPQISLQDFSIRDLYENLVVNKSNGDPVGAEFVNTYFDPRMGGMMLNEAAGAMDAVDSSMFMGITGQLLVVQILQGYNAEDFIATKMVPTYSSPFEQEKWPGISLPKDPGKNVLRVAEQEPFRTVGFGEEYVQTPLTQKEGVIIPVTKEAIFFDRTGLVSERANSVGYLLGLSKEKEILGVMVGGTTDPVYFVEKRQFDSAPLTLDLFQLAGAGSGARQLAYTYPSRVYPWYNDVPSNPLVDYTSLRVAEQYFSKTVDPNTGEPIVIGRPNIFACETRKMDLAQILQAENVFKITNSGLSTSGGLMTMGPNPAKMLGTIDFKTSRQLRAQLIAQLGMTDNWTVDQVWFYGDPTQAFAYVENWPITVVQAPVNSEAEFNQDIVLRWKASRRGRMAIKEARAWQRHNHASEASGV
jgi:hypothetical protein